MILNWNIIFKEYLNYMDIINVNKNFKYAEKNLNQKINNHVINYLNYSDCYSTFIKQYNREY
jgi:hypothetical protein